MIRPRNRVIQPVSESPCAPSPKNVKAPGVPTERLVHEELLLWRVTEPKWRGQVELQTLRPGPRPGTPFVVPGSRGRPVVC
jgi:hypothetical protein